MFNVDVAKHQQIAGAFVVHQSNYSKRIVWRQSVRVWSTIVGKLVFQLIVSVYFHFDNMQRWPKYGNTDVNTRTVHDLLNTINTMSVRIKALERYEHALREIHKVIVIAKPSANIHGFEPDALPALVMQCLSDVVNRDGNTLTHNINYKYDYNYNNPFGNLPPPPSSSSNLPQPPPPQPPFPPPPSNNPYFNYYPFYSPYNYSSPPPPPAPSSQQSQTTFANINDIGGSQSLNQINLTSEEEAQLAILYENMQNNMRWEYFESFVDTLIKIIRVHIVNSVVIVNAISSSKNVKKLINIDFIEFLKCVRQKTDVHLQVDRYVCDYIAVFIQFFMRIYVIIKRTELTWTQQISVQQLTEYSNEMYNDIQNKYNNFTLTPPPSSSLATPFLASDTNNTTLIELQRQLTAERSQIQLLQEQNAAYDDQIRTVKTQYDTLVARNKQLIDENAEMDRNLALQRDGDAKKIKELNSSVKRLQQSQSELADQNVELQNKILDLNYNIKTLNDDLNDLKEENRRMSRDNRFLQSKLRKNIETAESEFIAELNVEIDNLRRRLDNVQSKNANLTRQLAEINDVDREMEASVSRIDYLNSQIEDKQRQIERLQQINVTLEKSRTLQSTETNEQMTLLQNTIEYLQKENDNLQEIVKSNENVAIEYEQALLKIKYYDTHVSDVISYVNDYYKAIGDIDPNRADYNRNLIKNENDIVENPFEIAEAQHNYIRVWLQSIQSRLSTADLVNLQQENYYGQYNDIKSQITNIIPLNIIQKYINRDSGGNVKQENLNVSDIVLISSVSELVRQYDALAKENNAMQTQNNTLKEENDQFKREYASKINALENQLKQNIENVKFLSALASSDPALKHLNDQSYQELKRKLDTLQNECVAVKNVQRQDLNDIAEQAVKIEIGKLNKQIEKINILFVKYDSKSKDIFEWKGQMLKMYETLARSVAASEQTDVTVE
ncbi:desmoplakin [Catopsilia pomona nucleopolyhedrovirus]|uniref:Desmoplakin n=1 Tax=Catopsilia pomona nucleopolyhedrovirus TaxID=1850906 RepID=A0A172WZF3_9ABAC|nr:desmoplakin [Catopsilia pomona nucleopolyhedrovirus]ANF29722.1 desmoplakin [Catopsilia pomona nucleopolyhedrovirus]